ncbi:MAG: ECF-type sigma factor [Bryobacteraceae bacterium]
MAGEGPKDVTRLLVAWSNGDRAALDALVPLIYAELHRLASRSMRREGPGSGEEHGQGTRFWGFISF